MGFFLSIYWIRLWVAWRHLASLVGFPRCSFRVVLVSEFEEHFWRLLQSMGIILLLHVLLCKCMVNFHVAVFFLSIYWIIFWVAWLQELDSGQYGGIWLAWSHFHVAVFVSFQSLNFSEFEEGFWRLLQSVGIILLLHVLCKCIVNFALLTLAIFPYKQRRDENE